MDTDNIKLRRPIVRQYTIEEISDVVLALREAKPDGRTIIEFDEAKVNFRTSPVKRFLGVSEHVWCYGTVELRKGKNDIYTILGTVEGRDSFSYVVPIKDWRAIPFPPKPVLAGFRKPAPEGASGYQGDVIITPYRRD